MRVEVRQCHAVGQFSIEFRLKFSGFRKIDLHVYESDSLFRIGVCVFNSGADYIHECHQGVELGVGAQKNEENVINETFPKVNQIEESQDSGAFLLAHEQIGIGWSHPGSHGRTKDLVYMRVREFEGAMFEDEIEYDAHYMGRWTVCGKQVLVFFLEVNHGCYSFFVWNVCLQGRDISCDQEGIWWEGWEFLNEVEKMFCIFDVGWEVGSQGLDKIGDLGREMVN